MPQTRRVTWAQLRVGVMAIASITILVVLVFLITGRGGLFTKTAQIRTYVDDSSALKVGQPVRLNGIEVGNVKSVGLSGQGGGRTIEIVMSIRREYVPSIPTDSKAAISPEGVFGDKYINITRGESPKSVPEGGEIPSLDTKEFQEIVNQSYNVLASLNAITNRINKITEQVEQGRGTIGKLLYDETLYDRMDKVVAQAHDVVAAVGDGKGTIGKLLADDQLYNQANATMRRVDTVIGDVQSGKGTLGMLIHDPALYQNANRILEQAHKTVDGVNAGQGTLGKLLNDEELYRRANATLVKINDTVDRANSGQGTIGQLLVNRALYDTITGTTTEMRQLVRDVRANPKKFLRIKLGLF